LFTGIIEETGVVRGAERRGDVLEVRLEAKATLQGLSPGGSIALSGCCVTAVGVFPDGFSCELTHETLSRTAFSERLRPGRVVNLERPLRADGRFDGHIVQGHVDGVCVLKGFHRLGSSAELLVEAPESLSRYLVPKGSIALEGISLTLVDVASSAFTVAIIPYTLERTSLGSAEVGDRLNLEVDLVAKYVEKLLNLR
jgi:riboflavin synthase